MVDGRKRIEALASIIKHVSPLSGNNIDWYKAEEKKAFTIADFKIIYSCQVAPKINTDFGSYIIRVDTEANTLCLYFGENSIVFGKGGSEIEVNLINKLIKEVNEYMEQQRLKSEEIMLENIKTDFS